MNLSELLSQPRPIVADGSWGVLLAQRGLGHDVPETWNLTHPDVVASIAADYAAAGAQIVLTNTFGGTRVKLDKGHVADHDAVNKRGAELSRQAVGHTALVFASIGPTGELIGLTSTLTEADIERTFADQAAAILEGNPDGFIIETFADLVEAQCAIRGIQSVCDLPVAVSLAFDEGTRGPATMMGVTPDEAARVLTDAGADLVGANCGRLSDDAWRQIVSTMSAATSLPIWAKANAGIPQLVAGKSEFPMDPAGFAALGKSLAAEGAKVIGGCCGATPAHIAALAEALS